MANLLSIAELEWNRIFPNGSDETKITKQEFIASAKTFYASAMWLQAKMEKREVGIYDVPSFLTSVVTLPVENNEINTSGLKTLRSLPDEGWLINVGGIGSCYVRSTIRQRQLLVDDDSANDNDVPYYVLGDVIRFDKRVEKKELPVYYANMGQNQDGKIEIPDEIAELVRAKLAQTYERTGKEDQTNNSSSDT